MLTVLVTCVSFGLMNTYQPRVEATRATLVYLFEPIFAAGFAWLVEGATMSRSALYGAGLILVSNIVAELKWPGEPKANRWPKSPARRASRWRMCQWTPGTRESGRKSGKGIVRVAFQSPDCQIKPARIAAPAG